MQGTPANTVILHWNECQTAWMELPCGSGFDFEDLVTEVPVCSPGPRLASITSCLCAWRWRRARQRDPAQDMILSNEGGSSRIRWARSVRA